ncbi:MAG: thioesterase family protein [Bacteroidota bacterium]
MSNTILSAETEVRVRFSEVDSLRIVWHGNYFKYFEEAREAFGNKYEISYLDYLKNKILAPIVHVDCDYKLPLVYGDVAIVLATYENTDAAKIVINFEIFRKSDLKVIATGQSIQVFLNEKRELLLTFPQFILDWKKKWGLL